MAKTARLTAMLNILPKFELVPISRYFMTLPKALAAFDDAFVEHPKTRFEENDVGCLPGDIDGGEYRDPDVGGMK